MHICGVTNGSNPDPDHAVKDKGAIVKASRAIPAYTSCNVYITCINVVGSSFPCHGP